MATLFESLTTAIRSLLARQEAGGVTTPDLSRMNIPGGSGGNEVLTEDGPKSFSSPHSGEEESQAGIAGIRDRVLGLRVDQESQQQSRLEWYLEAMQQVEALFDESQGVGLPRVIDRFFNRVQALSDDPSSLPLRQGVLTAAANLSTDFRQLAASLKTMRKGLDRQAKQSLEEINELAWQLAAVNERIASLQGARQGAEDLTGRRNWLVNELSHLIDNSTLESGDGSLTIATSGGAALVVGTKSFRLEALANPATGFTKILSQGTDITGQISGGKLAGTLQARDQDIPGLQDGLDNIAAALSAAINAAHRQGYDLSGSPGGDFFVPFTPSFSGSNAGSAASLAVALRDPSTLASSSDGTPGDSGNLRALANIRGQRLIGGKTVQTFYAKLILGIGNAVSKASAELEAEGMVLEQLENQRAAISGVSLDEETAHLFRYQRAFEAASGVVTVVDQVASSFSTSREAA